MRFCSARGGELESEYASCCPLEPVELASKMSTISLDTAGHPGPHQADMEAVFDHVRNEEYNI